MLQQLYALLGLVGQPELVAGGIERAMVVQLLARGNVLGLLMDGSR